MQSRHRAQVWRHQPSFLRPRHFHAEPEINWVVKGNGRVGIGAHERRVSAGDVLLLPPGLDHVLLDASADFELFVSALKPELAARALGAKAASSGAIRLDHRQLDAAAMELAALSDLRDPTAHEQRLGDLFEAMNRTAAQAHVLSRRLLEGVRLKPELSESAFARRFCTSPSEASRQFRRDFGVTFVDYRSRVRVMRFVERVDGGGSLLRAALAAGFGSYAQCHRVFRRALGCSPSAYFAGARHGIDATTVEPVWSPGYFK